MRKCIGFLLVLGLAACDLSTEPELRNQSTDLEQIAQWSSTISGISAAVTGSLQLREFGSYGEANIAITGAQPARGYQWRIFRGDCSESAPVLHSTIQAYPDLVTDGSGAATLTRTLAGALNTPSGKYSVRLRLSTTATNWNGTSPVACGNLQKS